MDILEMQWKIPKKFFLFEIMAFEIVAGNSAYCDGNTRHRQSMCQQTVLIFQIWLKQTFSNSIYLELERKSVNSAVVLIWAVFGTH